jgi:anti-anti-sigma factor
VDALLQCSSEETPEALVIHPIGELDHETVAILRPPLTAGVESGRHVLIDMAGVQHIDSLGIHELLVHRRLCRARGRCLVLVAPRGPVQRVISIVDLGKVIPVFPSMDLALGSLRAGTAC